jgi:hypothetical protein
MDKQLSNEAVLNLTFVLLKVNFLAGLSFVRGAYGREKRQTFWGLPCHPVA